MINITDSAINELKKILENSEENMVRVFTAGYSWRGPALSIALDKQKEDDIVEEVDGIKFIAEPFMIESFKEFDIDYSNNFLRKGFSVSIAGQDTGSC